MLSAVNDPKIWDPDEIKHRKNLSDYKIEVKNGNQHQAHEEYAKILPWCQFL